MKAPLIYLWLFGTLVLSENLNGQRVDSLVLQRLQEEIMGKDRCYEQLRQLCKEIGPRLSGSPGADQALDWAEHALIQAGADRVWRQPITVPVWERGQLQMSFKSAATEGNWVPLKALALGNSVGTEGKLMEGPVRMVADEAQFLQLPDSMVQGHWIFFNHPFPQTLINPFEAYGKVGRYRWHAASWVSARGGKGVIIRSLSTSLEDVIHTGSLRYADTVDPIPAVTIGNQTAEKLEAWIQLGEAEIRMVSTARMRASRPSANLIAELRGETDPSSLVLVGAHLDSWDLGEGAHDDGAGVVQCIEVIRSLKALGIRPKRTIRIVLFMNEENGLEGGRTYADSARKSSEKHVLAVESDAGGFAPRGFGLRMDSSKAQEIRRHRSLFYPMGIYDFETESAGPDIYPLRELGVPLMALLPDPQRYFDLHHTDRDVFEQISHRELKIGALALTSLAYIMSEHGLGEKP